MAKCLVGWMWNKLLPDLLVVHLQPWEILADNCEQCSPLPCKCTQWSPWDHRNPRLAGLSDFEKYARWRDFRSKDYMLIISFGVPKWVEFEHETFCLETVILRVSLTFIFWSTPTASVTSQRASLSSNEKKTFDRLERWLLHFRQYCWSMDSVWELKNANGANETEKKINSKKPWHFV